METRDIPQGTIEALHGGKATVRITSGGCNGCGQGSSCSIGKLSSGRAPASLVLEAPAGLCVGDQVSLALPEHRLPGMALLGYLFPALAMLLGAGLGQTLAGSDAATALGAIIGFLASLSLVSLVVRHLPGLMPQPRIVPGPLPASRFIPIVPLTHTEPHHER